MSNENIELEEDEYTSQITGKTFKRIAGLLKPHWTWVVGFLITIMITSVLDAYFTYINKQIVDTGIVPGNSSVLLQLGVTYGSFVLVQAVTVFTFISLAGVLGERIQYDLRKSMFNHLQDLSLSYYSQTSVGRMIARVTSDSGRVADLMTWGMVDSTWAVMNIITSTIFMFIINWQLALAVFLVIPIDQDDADAATREKFCHKSAAADCRLETPDALSAFARATAAKQHDRGGLAIQLAPRS